MLNLLLQQAQPTAEFSLAGLIFVLLAFFVLIFANFKAKLNNRKLDLKKEDL